MYIRFYLSSHQVSSLGIISNSVLQKKIVKKRSNQLTSVVIYSNLFILYWPTVEPNKGEVNDFNLLTLFSIHICNSMNSLNSSIYLFVYKLNEKCANDVDIIESDTHIYGKRK